MLHCSTQIGRNIDLFGDICATIRSLFLDYGTLPPLVFSYIFINV